MGDSLPKTLLIPVETLNREFDAKLLLALKSIRRGWSPIIGGRTTIHTHLRKLPRSVYFAKGIRAGTRLMMSIIDDLGHVLVAQDEEALIRPSDDAFWMMLDEETFNRPRLLYAWGAHNADAWRRYDAYRDTPILPIGNPRVDVLRPEIRGYYDPAVAELKRRYGRFALLSTNFSVVNHFIPNHVRFRVASDVDQAKASEFKTDLVSHKRALFEAFKLLVPDLARALAPDTLVIRPHPSENASTWSAVSAGLENVQVVHEGGIAPWLLAATGLVQNGCTSAVEAAIAGTPAFAFRPVSNAEFDGVLPNSLSHECKEPRELIDAVTTASTEKANLTTAQRAILDEHVASLEGPFCCDRILQSLEDHHDRLAQTPHDPFSKLGATIRQMVRNAKRSVTTRKQTGKSSSQYTAHKFPGISEAQVNERIRRFRVAVPGLPGAAAHRIIDNVFEIRSA